VDEQQIEDRSVAAAGTQCMAKFLFCNDGDDVAADISFILFLTA
jgi:hypothetical protein